MQVPPIGGSNQPPPEQTFLLPPYPTRPEAQSSPLSSCPPQPQGPYVMLIWMWGASLSRDPPQGTAQQFQKNRDLYF